MRIPPFIQQQHHHYCSLMINSRNNNNVFIRSSFNDKSYNIRRCSTTANQQRQQRQFHTKTLTTITTNITPTNGKNDSRNQCLKIQSSSLPTTTRRRHFSFTSSIYTNERSKNWNNRNNILTCKDNNKNSNNKSLSSSSTPNILYSLCECNQLILDSKITLMNTILQKYGLTDGHTIFSNRTYPIINHKATIGQHYRHSLDHIEYTIHMLSNILYNYHYHNSNQLATPSLLTDYIIDYDHRQRNTEEERDWRLTKKRIIKLHTLLEEIKLQSFNSSSTTITPTTDADTTSDVEKDTISSRSSSSPSASSNLLSLSLSKVPNNIDNTIVQTKFKLSGNDNDDGTILSSTILRELGFVAHHAIHHMAIVRLLVSSPQQKKQSLSSLSNSTNSSTGQQQSSSLLLQPPLLGEHEIPINFGVAPSTIQYNNVNH